ncbi:MAG: hypothetical protein ABR582_17775, partial [Gemmatimonadaceae bacterium]
HDLREKILVGSPDIRVLSFGEDLKITDWPTVLAKVRNQPGVVAAAPFVLTESLMTAGHDYSGGVYVVGLLPESRGVPNVTTIRSHATSGDSITLLSTGGVKLSDMNPVTGGLVPHIERFEVTGIVQTGMYEYDNAYVFVALDKAQTLAGLGSGVTGIEVKTADRWQAQSVASHLV